MRLSLVRVIRHGALVLPLALLAAACSDFVRLVSPGSKGATGPAMLAFTASVPRLASSATDLVTLNATASYVRQDGTRVRIGSQLLTLTAEALQSVPIPVDVASCLADPARDTGPPGAGASCAVEITLALLVNNVVVDQQVVGPVRLSPGATTTLPQPVTLIDLASVSVLQSGSVLQATDTARAILGAAASVSARVLDTKGLPVTDRQVTWSASAPAVATIDPNSGAITGVSVGTATITASIGALSASVPLRVLRAPAALSISIGAGSGSGSVRSQPAGIDCRIVGAVATGVCTFMFPGDASVSLTSTADAGSVFATWGDACVAAAIGPTCQVTMSQARVATVRFSALRRLTVAASPNGDGRGRVSGVGGLDCRLSGTSSTGVCTVEVPEGVPYQLSALVEPSANGGAQQYFFSWGGDCVSATGATCMVTPGTSNLSVTARFMDVQPVTVSLAGTGGGTVTGGSRIACARASGTNSGTCVEAASFGTVITVTALADAQSTFAGWSGACTAAATTCATTLTESRSVTATFTRRQVALTVTLTGSGQGTVLANGLPFCTLEGAQTSKTCTGSYDLGSAVALSLRGGSGAGIGGFGGVCEGKPECVIVMSAAQNITAAFAPSQFTLTVTISGKGAGSVSNSAGWSCGTSLGQTNVSCQRTFDAGVTVELRASPSAESEFAGFSGDCAGNGSCVVVMSAPRTVGAAFSRRQVTLTLRLSGVGAGSVFVDGVVACTLALGQASNTCTRPVEPGTSIVVTGVAASGSTFDGFGGDCAGVSACTLTPAGSANVTLAFKGRQFPVTITVGGSGGGSVTVDGVQACALSAGQGSASCSRLVDAGATVQLAAAAAAGSTFEGFSGDCSGASQCALTVIGPASVAASFSSTRVTLTLTLSGSGSGTVSMSGVAPCVLSPGRGSVTCVRDVGLGSTIQLDASPDGGSFFAGFGGDCVSPPGRLTACSVSVTSARSVSGAFNKTPAVGADRVPPASTAVMRRP